MNGGNSARDSGVTCGAGRVPLTTYSFAGAGFWVRA
jgi:hypothetical protein